MVTLGVYLIGSGLTAATPNLLHLRVVLEYFFHVKPTDTAYYFMAFAAGNLLGPLTGRARRNQVRPD